MKGVNPMAVVTNGNQDDQTGVELQPTRLKCAHPANANADQLACHLRSSNDRLLGCA